MSERIEKFPWIYVFPELVSICNRWVHIHCICWTYHVPSSDGRITSVLKAAAVDNLPLYINEFHCGSWWYVLSDAERICRHWCTQVHCIWMASGGKWQIWKPIMYEYMRMRILFLNGFNNYRNQTRTANESIKHLFVDYTQVFNTFVFFVVVVIIFPQYNMTLPYEILLENIAIKIMRWKLPRPYVYAYVGWICIVSWRFWSTIRGGKCRFSSRISHFTWSQIPEVIFRNVTVAYVHENSW